MAYRVIDFDVVFAINSIAQAELVNTRDSQYFGAEADNRCISRAATSNRATNPLLQDVNVGWLQKMRANAAARVMTQIGVTGKIQIGDAIDSAHG